MIKIKKLVKSKKSLIVLVLLVITVGTASFVYANRKDSDKPSAESSPAQTDDTINYAPPTEEDKQEVEQHKKELGSASQPPSPSNGQVKVTPVITSAQQSGQELEVYAYVPGIFEEGGTCTMTAKMGSKTVSVTSSAFANATTTDCQRLVANRASFPQAGTWQVMVSYNSSKASGSSQSVNVNLK